MNAGVTPNSTARDRLVARASAAVAKAVRSGEIPHFSKFKCIDCGEPAECYDHRDYRKPLTVDPVCKGCNNRRGPGLPLPEREDGAHYKISWFNKRKNKGWSAVEPDGEGYDPNLCILNGITTQDINNALLAESSRYSFVEALSSEEKRRSRFYPVKVGARGGFGGGFIYLNDIKRCRYFKGRDPWCPT
jgi:hypothetical protein